MKNKRVSTMIGVLLLTALVGALMYFIGYGRGVEDTIDFFADIQFMETEGEDLVVIVRPIAPNTSVDDVYYAPVEFTINGDKLGFSVAPYGVDGVGYYVPQCQEAPNQDLRVTFRGHTETETVRLCNRFDQQLKKWVYEE